MVPAPEALHALRADQADEAGRAHIDHVEYVVKRRAIKDETDDEGDLKLLVNCPDGKKVIGGGVTTTGAERGAGSDFEVRVSGPKDENTWFARVNPSSADADDVVKVTAICANVEKTDTNLIKGGSST
jgi:hypothetical protein